MSEPAGAHGVGLGDIRRLASEQGYAQGRLGTLVSLLGHDVFDDAAIESVNAWLRQASLISQPLIMAGIAPEDTVVLRPVSPAPGLQAQETAALTPPLPGREWQLTASLVLDAAGGLLGWSRRRQGVEASIERDLPPGATVESDGTDVHVFAASQEAVAAARAAIEAIITPLNITASFRLARWDSAAGEWEGAARVRLAPVLISTMNDVPGHDIVEVMGEVYGLTVRSRGAFPQFGANLKSVVGGELVGMTKLLSRSRDEVTERIMSAARARQANAIVAFRFDSSEIGGNWTEICAYGTAVRIRPSGEPPASPGAVSPA